ncbi:MAG TPA: hypothetical protein VFJ16_19260 [Longimicrobium sp.]|nr:hypothetical protein [Longimicrobium sp.]
MVCLTACSMVLALLAADTGAVPRTGPEPPAAVAGPAAATRWWDDVRFATPPLVADGPSSAAIDPSPAVVPVAPVARADTGQPRAFEYSDAYGTRLAIHRIASYAMIPLFAAQYAAGDQLMRKGSSAPGWARSSHGALAAGVAALFTVNTVTGGWNLIEARHDPEGRTRRTLHGVLMLAADAGFTATGLLANRAENDAGARDLHRTVAIGSMGVSLLSYAIMLPIFGRN